jgi:hypothetical protein
LALRTYRKVHGAIYMSDARETLLLRLIDHGDKPKR